MDAGKQQNQATRIEALIQDVAAFPEPQVRTKMEELLQALLELYGEGLTHILEITAGSEAAGQALIEEIASDELVGALLLLHGLHPVDLETRLRQTLEDIRPAVRAQGGTLEFVRLEHGVATVRLAGGGCQNCQASQTRLRQMVEEAIYSAIPDLDDLQVEENAASRRGGIPVTFVSPRLRQRSVSPGTSANVSSSQGSGHLEVR